MAIEFIDIPDTPKGKGKSKGKEETLSFPARDTTPDAFPPKIAHLKDETLELPFTPPAFDMAAALADPMREMASRILCRRKLMPFIKRFRPKYDAGWVHYDICRRLEQFVKDVEARKSPRLLLMMPPRGGKSEIGSRHFPPWVFGQFPDWEIIAASHTSSLSLSFSRYIRDLLRDPAYRAIFTDTLLDPSSQSVENWNLTGGGGYLSAGVGTGITGRGANILLLDDLVKDIEAADSPVIRDNTWEWYASTAYTRLAPGGGVLGIMTWWHENDWAGRIQEVMAQGDGDIFEVVRYPAINEEGDEYILHKLPGQPIVQYPPGSTLPDTDTTGATLTRPHGTALHPARYTTEMMLKIKNNLVASGQKRIWQSLYQQDPTPDDGLYFTKDMFQFYTMRPSRADINIFQAWDFAITEGTENDYTVGTTLAQDHRDNLYVLDVRRFKTGDGDAIIDTILDYYAEFDADLLGFEDGQIWKSLQSFFERRCSDRRLYPSYEILKPLTDKLVRAQPLRGRMQGKKVFFDKHAPWYNALQQELTRFPAGKHDDQVDSLSWCTRLSLLRPAPKDPTPHPKFKSWKDKLRLLSGSSLSSGAGHMSA